MEVEFIRASMDVRAEKERLRQRPHARFEKVDGERNSPLRLQWGEEREPWVWQVEVRPSVRCIEFEGTTGHSAGTPGRESRPQERGLVESETLGL